MRTLALLPLVVLALVLASPTPVAAQDRVDLAGLSGGRLTDSDLASGRHVLVVWASWSPRSRDIVERVEGLARSVGSRARVATIVFQEDRSTVEQFLQQSGRLSVPIYLDTDGAFSKKHGVTTLPGLLILTDGAVAFQGQLPTNPEPVLDKALGG